MEPTLIAILLIGIPIGAWATYEGIEYIRRWLNEVHERKAYENYIRMYNQEKSRYTSDGDDYDDDDKRMPLNDTAISSGWMRVNSGTVKNREDRDGWEHYKISEQDLLAMESQFNERKEQLRQEQAIPRRVKMMQISQRVASTQTMGLVNNNNNNSNNSSSSRRRSDSNNSIGRNGSTSNGDSAFSPSMSQWQFDSSPNLRGSALPSPEYASLHPASNNDQDHFLMPAPPQYMRRNTDDSSASYFWANVHSREHSNESDVSYSSISSSIGVPMSESSASLSYGVRSITSDDGQIA